MASVLTLSYRRTSVPRVECAWRPRGVNEVMEEILTQWGGIDIAVNSVGGSGSPSGGVLALADETIGRTS